MYGSEREKAIAKRFSGSFDEVSAGEVFAQHMLGASTDHLLELSAVDRSRIFNLGYYTWVEQQGVSVAGVQRRGATSGSGRGFTGSCPRGTR